MQHLNQTITTLILLIMLPLTSISQSVYESYESNFGNSIKPKVDKPHGVVENDLLVISLAFDEGEDEIIYPPDGWMLIDRVHNTNNNGLATYYKIASANEPNKYTFETEEHSTWSIGISRISNVNISSPIDAMAATTCNAGAMIAPSIITNGEERLVLCFYSNNEEATYTEHASTKKRYDAPNTQQGQPSNMLATFVQAIAFSTGDKEATASIEGAGTAQQVSIVPATSPPLLPVEWKDFNVQPCGTNVCIDWATSVEIDNNYFNIERSYNAIDWETINTIQGMGDSQLPQNYSYIDHHPFNGENLYRIKQIDFDGNSSYTETKIADIDIPEKRTAIFPNPATNMVTITNIDAKKDFHMFDQLGRNVTAQVESISSKELGMRLDISTLSSGYYIATVDNVSVKFLKK